jgi:hypothetical protein
VAACTSRDSPHTLSRQAEHIPAPKELVTHVSVVAHLRARGAPDWSFNHPAGGEVRDKRTAQKLKAMGVMPGRPDLELISPDGRYHALELKRRGGRLNDAQKVFRFHCIRQGWPYVVADSVDEALRALEEWGALRPAIGGRHG